MAHGLHKVTWEVREQYEFVDKLTYPYDKKLQMVLIFSKLHMYMLAFRTMPLPLGYMNLGAANYIYFHTNSLWHIKRFFQSIILLNDVLKNIIFILILLFSCFHIWDSLMLDSNFGLARKARQYKCATYCLDVVPFRIIWCSDL